MRNTLLSLVFLFPFALKAQLYYPPTTGNNWDTVSIQSLGWCQDKVDTLLDFAGQKNSKSLLILHKGKIAIEKYYGTYERDSIWYWASAGKSLAAFLVGCAQEDGDLSISDSTSAYLGQGWTSCTPAQEGQITVKDQISMTTGLNWQTHSPNCLIDSCLDYLGPPGSFWFYHNAPYRLVLDVLVAASGSANINLYTFQRLGSRIGMGGLWLDYVRFGKARDMARFGLLVQGKGVWDGDTVLADTSYLHDMTHSSQSHNPAYGYLWWLNGQGSYQQPGWPFLFQGDIVPSAPDDMFAAMGKNDQRIYVVPSLDLVVVRQGNLADTAALALSGFDEALWSRIMDLECSTSASEPAPYQSEWDVFPNPADQSLQLRISAKISSEARLEMYDLEGRKVLQKQVPGDGEIYSLDVSTLSEGLHFVKIIGESGNFFHKVWIQHR